MITEIAASVAAAKNIADLLKAAKGAANSKDSTAAIIEANGRLMDLQGFLMDARQAAFEYEQTISELKQQIRDMNDWKAELENYQLTEIKPGALAYALKPEIPTTHPPHYLCANCFGKRQKSILQYNDRNVHKFYECYACTSRVSI